ncbi:MAG: AAA family ATPase [Flavobacteriaceae bacterium]|nr:AAA family ATPase [Flavobacteriaceae bacterium]
MFNLVFRTTNKAKFAHLEYALRGYDIVLKTVGEYGKPYTEPRVFNRKEILEESLLDSIKREIKKTSNSSLINDIESKKILTKGEVEKIYRLYRGSAFIIEDTSVRINALSSDAEEVPGVDIKYWMKNMTFEKLDELLKEKGNDRKVSVRSDIVLFMPELIGSESANYISFVGISEGSVIEHEVKFETNRVYPWLDNKTFNRWFIPHGENKPISMLDVKTASKYDFRIKAAIQMAEFLVNKKYAKLCNSNEDERSAIQLRLFEQTGYIFCGPTCSGKSVLARHIAHKYNYYHIEASDFMYLKYYQLHGTTSGISIHEFATDILKEDPFVVARQLVKYINKIKSLPFTITGFRSKREIEFFLKFHRGENPLKIFYIYTDVNKRFERNIKRNRDDRLESVERFRIRDKLQFSIGLDKLEVDDDLIKIKNEKSIRDYYRYFDFNYSKKENVSIYHYKNNITRFTEKSPTLEQAILLTLLRHYGNSYFATHELSNLINGYLSPLRKKVSGANVGRYFNQRFHPYYEIKLRGNKNTYRLSQTGISEAILQEQILLT